MSHQHAKIYKDETSEKTIGSHHLPRPLNWKVLVQPHQVRLKTKGGLHLPSVSKDNEEYLTAHGRIASMGDLAFKDKDKFPTGAWCEAGNWVMFARYAGSRFKIDGGEVRILNDDEVLARILEPEDILHF